MGGWLRGRNTPLRSDASEPSPSGSPPTFERSSSGSPPAAAASATGLPATFERSPSRSQGLSSSQASSWSPGAGPGRLGVIGPVLAVLVFAAAIGGYVVAVRHDLENLWNPLDLRVYLTTASGTRHGHNAYAITYHNLPFTYTPFALGVFMKLVRYSFEAIQWGVAIGSIAALVATLWASTGLDRIRPSSTSGRLTATLLLSAVGLWLEPVQQTLLFGQVNLFLMALVALDLAQSDRRPWKGVGVGLAAGFKLTPVVFIGYLLVTRRFRAAALAAGTLFLTVAGGFVLLPREARRYWLDRTFLDSSRVGRADYVSNQTVSGVVHRLFGINSLTAQLGWVIGAGLIGLAGAALMVWAHRRGEELLAISTCALTGLLISPISWSHHWVWAAVLIAAIVQLALRYRSRLAWALALAVTAVFGCYPVVTPGYPALPLGLIWTVPFRDGREHGWHGIQLLAGNLYALTGVALLALLALYLWRSRPVASGTARAAAATKVPATSAAA